MAFTDHSDVFAGFHEDGFNAIIKHIMLQRPSMFNYATEDLTSPRYAPPLCEKIKYHPAVEEFGNPLVTPLPYMPILGYGGPYGMSYSFQVGELVIDFHPNNIIGLPPELGPHFGEQHIALKGKICAGVGCPDKEFVNRLINKIDPNGKESKPEPPTRPFPFKKLTCFCLELFADLTIIRNNGYVELRLSGLELNEIKPDGLENALECYISMVFQLTLFPKLRIALGDLIFKLNEFISLTPAPISSDIPFNPSVENDRVSVFINLL